MSLTGAGLNSMRSIPTFGTVGAIAEIVDNSIQWKTIKDVDINIIFIQKDQILDEILIIDNGKGMGLDSKGKEIIDYCLYFGGGTNHGAKEGLGKFGIGLPYACCSQATEYHVYTWQQKNKIKHIYRNHEDFKQDDPVIDEPHNTIEVFPEYFENYLPELKKYNSGTIVQWKNCDRLTYKKANTIMTHLEHRLGRIYRHFIGNGVSINFKAYNQPKGNYPSIIEDLCRPIRKFDPLFLETGTIADIYNNGQPTSEKFCPDKTIIFTDSEGIKHEFLVRASYAKEHIQYPDGTVKSKGGRKGLIGGDLYGKVQGISLVRAKRELRIHHFDFPLDNGYSDPKHRWWKIEIQFQPISDELLGVNANKTDALNFRYISDKDQEDQTIDYIKLRYTLAAHIKNLMDEINNAMEERKEQLKNPPKFQKCSKCQNISLKNGKCITDGCGNEVSTCQKLGHENIELINGECPACKNVEVERLCTKHNIQFNEKNICPKCEETIPLTEDEIDELIGVLENYREFNGDKDSIRSLITWFSRSNKKQFIVFVSNPMNTSQFFEIKPLPNKFDIILVNKSHPFYKKHIGPLRELAENNIIQELDGVNYDFEEALDSLVLFIISWAHTERASTSDQGQLKRFRQRFGINLNEIMDIWHRTS